MTNSIQIRTLLLAAAAGLFIALPSPSIAPGAGEAQAGVVGSIVNAGRKVGGHIKDTGKAIGREVKGSAKIVGKFSKDVGTSFGSGAKSIGKAVGKGFVKGTSYIPCKIAKCEFKAPGLKLPPRRNADRVPARPGRANATRVPARPGTARSSRASFGRSSRR